MPSHLAPAALGVRSRPSPAIGLLAGLGLAVLVAGCSTGGLPASPAVTSPPAGGVTPGTSPNPAATISPAPTTSAIPGATSSAGVPGDPGIPGATAGASPSEITGPPAAAIATIGGEAAPGALGGFTWQGAGSDAPWIVPPVDEAVHGPGPYGVTFDPPLPVDSWVARWAPVADGAAGDTAGFEQGGPGPLVIRGPREPGTWSLQVDVRFGAGDRAAFYWRLEVAP